MLAAGRTMGQLRLTLHVSAHILRDVEAMQWRHRKRPATAISEGLTLLLGLYGVAGADCAVKLTPPVHDERIDVMPPAHGMYEGTHVLSVTLTPEDAGVVESLTESLDCTTEALVAHAIHVARAISDQRAADGSIEPM